MKPDQDPAPAPHPWDAASDEVQERDLRRAIVQEAGNITRAAEAIEISRSQVTKLVKKYALGALAAQLRLAAGATRVLDGTRKGLVPGLGRPRNGGQSGRLKR